MTEGRVGSHGSRRAGDVVRTVLVVDDEAKLRRLIRDYLERDGYTVLEAADGERALELAAHAHPDLVILDLGLPGLSGQEVARSLRQTGDVAIVILTAHAQEADRVAGLRAGADDYVVKPFSPRELIARVEAVLRRTAGAEPEVFSYGGDALRIDQESREVSVDGRPVDLTRSEFDLLSTLATRPGRAWSRLELVTRVQGHDYAGYERTVDAHVKNLRRKLADVTSCPRFVVTVPGVGYKLAARRDG